MLRDDDTPGAGVTTISTAVAAVIAAIRACQTPPFWRAGRRVGALEPQFRRRGKIISNWCGTEREGNRGSGLGWNPGVST